MNTDDTASRDAFPVDQPLEALRRDHGMVRRLAAAYRDGHSEDARQQAARQLLLLLDNHSRLEELVFYPRVNGVDPEMVERFQHVHAEADDLVATLKDMQLETPQADALLRQLLDITLQHIEQEETLLFPRVERAANLDMADLGMQMQLFEANLVHQQAQGRQADTRR